MRLSILFLTILAALTTLTTTQEISRTLPPAGNNTHPGSCGYYLTSHPANRGYFRHHRFYDFRNIVDDASGVAPGEVTQDGGLEEATSGFFWEETWRREWVVQSWGKKTSGKCPVKMQHSSGNVYIEHNDEAAESATTHLTLRTSRQSTFQSTSEIEGTQKNLLYASIRMRARVQGASGAVAGLFTYLDDENEGDIEILTRESEATVNYTNQPSLSLPPSPIIPPHYTRKTWNTHRMDWLPGQTTWFINDLPVLSSTSNVPSTPLAVVLNMWSDGGEWSGEMAVGGQATLQVLWMEVVYNVSEPLGNGGKERHGEGKGALCAVDGTERPGVPEVFVPTKPKTSAGQNPQSSPSASPSSSSPAASPRPTWPSRPSPPHLAPSPFSSPPQWPIAASTATTAQPDFYATWLVSLICCLWLTAMP